MTIVDAGIHSDPRREGWFFNEYLTSIEVTKGFWWKEGYDWFIVVMLLWAFGIVCFFFPLTCSKWCWFTFVPPPSSPTPGPSTCLAIGRYCANICFSQLSYGFSVFLILLFKSTTVSTCPCVGSTQALPALSPLQSLGLEFVIVAASAPACCSWRLGAALHGRRLACMCLAGVQIVLFSCLVFFF